MEIIKEGIWVKTARSTGWVARVGDEAYHCFGHKPNNVIIADPNAKIGCWVEITYVLINGINNSKKKTIRGFLDLETAEFRRRTDPTKIKKCTPQYYAFRNMSRIDKPSTDAIEQKIIKAVSEHMLEKWQKKFEKEHKKK
jgi:hypothetical protein